jgi:hypothetical protein
MIEHQSSLEIQGGPYYYLPFQKVHQTYTRTELWKQICEKLKISFLPIHQQLGEDRLAHFDAYSEYKQ